MFCFYIISWQSFLCWYDKPLHNQNYKPHYIVFSSWESHHGLQKSGLHCNNRSTITNKPYCRVFLHLVIDEKLVLSVQVLIFVLILIIQILIQPLHKLHSSLQIYLELPFIHKIHKIALRTNTIHILVLFVMNLAQKVVYNFPLLFTEYSEQTEFLYILQFTVQFGLFVAI